MVEAPAAILVLGLGVAPPHFNASLPCHNCCWAWARTRCKSEVPTAWQLRVQIAVTCEVAAGLQFQLPTMQPTRAMRTRMAKWDPGMAVDIDTADAGTLGAIVVGPAANGDSTQLRVVFSDGTEEDQDVSSLRFPRDRCDEVGPDNSATSSATQRVQDQARSDEHEVSTSRSLPRQRTSSHEEVVQRQQQEEAEASIVTAELAAWLQKRNLMHRAHVIAASLEASGARMGEWVDTLDSLVSYCSVLPRDGAILLQANETRGWRAHRRATVRPCLRFLCKRLRRSIKTIQKSTAVNPGKRRRKHPA